MTRVLAVCAFFAALVWWIVPAVAQDWNNYVPPQMGRDVIELRASEAGHLAELFYSNSADMASTGADRVYSYEHPTFGVIEVHVHIQINGEGQSEVITVTPLNVQHMPLPADPQPVADGEEVVIQIMGGVS